MRPLVPLSLLLVVAACADQTVTASASNSTTPLAVDLGGSSRVSHVAGAAGEGEGYGAVQRPAQPSQAVDHSQMDHSQMGHSMMNHAPIPASGGQ
jgi:hypothetical protein